MQSFLVIDEQSVPDPVTAWWAGLPTVARLAWARSDLFAQRLCY
jgi:hypothetical protein